MSHLDLMNFTGRRMPIMAGGMALAALVAAADCTLYQALTDGAVHLGIAARWAVAAVLPWAAAALMLERLRMTHPVYDSLNATAVAASLGFMISLTLDLLAFPADDWSEVVQRGRIRLALAALLVVLDRCWLAPHHRRVARQHLPVALPPSMAPAPTVLVAAGNYVEVEAGGCRRLVRATMREVEAMLDPSRHIRIHRSTIVALAEIAEIDRDRSGVIAVRLHDGRRLAVGRRYRGRFAGVRSASARSSRTSDV